MYLKHLEILRQLWCCLFTSICRMPFLLNSYSCLFFSVLVILSSISIPLHIHNWHGTLSLDITNGWYSPSNLSKHLGAKVFLKLEWLGTSKISKLLWWYILESNEAYHLLFFVHMIQKLQMYLSTVVVYFSWMSWYE